MNDPRAIAERLLGPVEWETVVSGFCRCPGAECHTHPTKPKDCRVSVDGAPTIHCFHVSCQAPVAEANRRLRRELGAGNWELALPGGRVLRPGDSLLADGSVAPRPGAHSGVAGGGASATSQGGGVSAGAARTDPAESVVLANVRLLAERFRPQLLERFRWPFAQILADSPLLVAERDADEQFRTWLRLWPSHCHVWIGDVYSSGRPEHRTHFRPVSDWFQIGPVMGNFTCGSAFKAGSYQRCNANLAGERFLVIESDTLSRDEVGAIFRYLAWRLNYRLHCIVDTAGKSLHAWFDAPANPVAEARLKAGLVVLGCDGKVFTYSQPVRLPGAFRDGRLQRIVWLKQ